MYQLKNSLNDFFQAIKNPLIAALFIIGCTVMIIFAFCAVSEVVTYINKDNGLWESDMKKHICDRGIADRYYLDGHRKYWIKVKNANSFMNGSSKYLELSTNARPFNDMMFGGMYTVDDVWYSKKAKKIRISKKKIPDPTIDDYEPENFICLLLKNYQERIFKYR